MADPKPESIDSVISGLIELPYHNFRKLELRTYSDQIKRPTEFVGETDPMKIYYGTGNLSELFMQLDDCLEVNEETISWKDYINPKSVMQRIFERIQILNSDRDISMTVDTVRNESDLSKRFDSGTRLKQMILEYMERFNVRPLLFKDEDKTMDPTWKNLTGLYSHVFVRDVPSGYSKAQFGLPKAIDTAQAALTRYPYEQNLIKIPQIDIERFTDLRNEFGAKGANLLLLSELKEMINNLNESRIFGVNLEIPEFRVLPVDVYRRWKNGGQVDEQLRPYFDWANSLKESVRRDPSSWTMSDYIVRSSAVHSEDGETITGAGIYDSELVYADSDFETFKKAVLKVYHSTESPAAGRYRKSNGVEIEEMGLVIQRYVSPEFVSGPAGSNKGYINSRIPGVPGLMEIVTAHSRNFVNREALNYFIAMDAEISDHAFRSVHHFRPDERKVNPDLIIRVSQLSYALERIWNRNLQLEFVGEGHTVHIVQIRALPEKRLESDNGLQFPDEKSIHSGAAIGYGDLVLPLLHNESDNTDRTGFVVFQSNDGWTVGSNNSTNFPKEGAVIIYDAAGINGHIQTICAEKGLICVYPDLNRDDRAAMYYSDLVRLPRVRVVSNGIEARIYKVE